VGEFSPLSRTIAEENLVSFCTFKVQMCIMFPGETDPTVNLDGGCCHAKVGITTG